MNRPTSVRFRTRPDGMRNLCFEVDRRNKARFECYQYETGERIAGYQGHTAQATPRVQNDSPCDQRYIIHGTSLSGARGIFLEGMQQLSGRQEYHFADANYTDRQAQNLDARRKHVWLMMGAVSAGRLGVTFRKLSNGVITTDGVGNVIPPDWFFDAYKPDGAKLKIHSLMNGRPILVSGAQDNLFRRTVTSRYHKTRRMYQSNPETRTRKRLDAVRRYRRCLSRRPFNRVRPHRNNSKKDHRIDPRPGTRCVLGR